MLQLVGRASSRNGINPARHCPEVCTIIGPKLIRRFSNIKLSQWFLHLDLPQIPKALLDYAHELSDVLQFGDCRCVFQWQFFCSLYLHSSIQNSLLWQHSVSESQRWEGSGYTLWKITVALHWMLLLCAEIIYTAFANSSVSVFCNRRKTSLKFASLSIKTTYSS